MTQLIIVTALLAIAGALSVAFGWVFWRLDRERTARLEKREDAL